MPGRAMPRQATPYQAIPRQAEEFSVPYDRRVSVGVLAGWVDNGREPGREIAPA